LLAAARVPAQTPLQRVLFGSCIEQTRPVPALESARVFGPDLFVFLGDNVYADTANMETMRRRYERLARKPEYRELLSRCPVEATWDDHDYGANDAGADYAMREASEEVFLDFWNVPADDPRRGRPGVYAARLFGPPDRRVQLILLDTRYFRSPLVRGGRRPGKGPYRPNEAPEATLLGEAQWRWLEEQLRVPARLRIVATSIQFSASHHGWESWANFPLEQERFFGLVRRTGAKGILFISGDRHMAELSVLRRPGLYPLYDLTSSGLNVGFPLSVPLENENRLEDAYLLPNFGLVLIDWGPEGAPASWGSPALTLEIRDKAGNVRLTRRVAAGELSLP
jgi:alkaline phosphatase D